MPSPTHIAGVVSRPQPRKAHSAKLSIPQSLLTLHDSLFASLLDLNPTAVQPLLRRGEEHLLQQSKKLLALLTEDVA